METNIWFPFYHGDYLKDTMQLSAERHGIYLLLIIHCWQNGYIEEDIDSISIITKVNKDNVSIKYLLDKYFKYEDGKYFQKRILREKEKAQTRKENARENGKKGGRPKKYSIPDNNPNETQGLLKTKANPNPEKSSSSSPSSSHIQSKSPINNNLPKFRHKHGEYKNVLLTDPEYTKLKTDFTNIDSMIVNLDEYIETTGKRYKNHNLVLRKWEKNNKPEKKELTEEENKKMEEEARAIWN